MSSFFYFFFFFFPRFRSHHSFRRVQCLTLLPIVTPYPSSLFHCDAFLLLLAGLASLSDAFSSLCVILCFESFFFFSELSHVLVLTFHMCMRVSCPLFLLVHFLYQNQSLCCPALYGVNLSFFPSHLSGFGMVKFGKYLLAESVAEWKDKVLLISHRSS